MSNAALAYPPTVFSALAWLDCLPDNLREISERLVAGGKRTEVAEICRALLDTLPGIEAELSPVLERVKRPQAPGWFSQLRGLLRQATGPRWPEDLYDIPYSEKFLIFADDLEEMGRRVR